MAESGKRVSYVELYLDLVFVLAVGQLAHLLIVEPVMRNVWIALGLFVVLWWTWVGFTVLYSRQGADQPGHRLLFLAASIPAGVAAVAVAPAAAGDGEAFAASLAVTRVLLAVAHARGPATLLRRRVTLGYLASAGLFALSIWVPEPTRYVLWAVAVVIESGALLDDDRRVARRVRRNHDFAALSPVDPAERLDAHHFAERFGLFLIIMLGEIVVAAGQASVDGHVAVSGGWAALVAAMILAAALWWLYFDSAAAINLRVLELADGSPSVARATFAVGHMLPAFALLLTAAGVGLLLEDHPPRFGWWAASIGIGIYLAGTRAFMPTRTRAAKLIRVLVLAATLLLALLRPELTPHEYLWLLAAWVALCAALTTRRAADAAPA